MKKILIPATIAVLIAVGISPAQANTVATSLAGGTGSGTAANPVVLVVPADNSVDTEVVAVTVTLPDSNTATSVTTTGAVRVLQSVGSLVTVDRGVTSLAVTPTTTSFVFYAYTTSTNTGTVVIATSGASTTLHVKGNAGAAYNVSLTAPSSINVNSVARASLLVTDVFGNPVAGHVATVSAINLTAGTVVATDAKGVSEFNLTSSTAGQAAVSATLAGNVNDVTGLAKAVKTTSRFVTVSDLAVENISLKAQNDSLLAENAKLKADLAAATAAAAAAKTEADKAVKALEARIAKLQANVARLKVRVQNLVKRLG